MALGVRPPRLAAKRESVSALARRARSSHRTIPLSLTAVSFLVAFLQSPMRVVADTRIELSVDPGLFLSRVGSVWSATGDLGHVQSSQFVGYLFPMGPWFAFAHWIGLPTLVAQRLWLGAILAVAAWGAVRLMDEIYGGPRGIAHLVAGLLFAFNPFVALFVSRGTGNLLAAAALPWLMLAVVRGVREPGRWRWPAFAALAATATAGGQNAAELGWLLPGVVGLLVYEVVALRRASAHVWGFAWRAGVCGLVASAWWLVPLLLSSRYQPDFLRFTEQPDAIYATTSAPESLRMLGYWVAYFGQGYAGFLQPATWSAPSYLFSEAVIVGTFAVPLFALVAGLRWLRGWAYAPFFALLAVGGVIAMSAAFPDTTPFGRAAVWLYYHVPGLSVMRTSYKAAPLVGLAIACLGGPVAAAALTRARRLGRVLLDTRVLGWAAAVLVAVLVLLWGFPLFRGHAIDRPSAYGHVPAAWRAAVADADRSAPPDRRLMVLPGALFANYTWGSTQSSVAPALARHPVAIREVTHYSDPRADQLQSVTDDLVGQGRLVPGQLDRLLGLLGVGQVLVASDADPRLTSALDPARLEQSLAQQQTFRRPLASYGPAVIATPPAGRGGPPAAVRELRRYAVGAPGGLVRLEPRAAPSIVDGDANGVTELAAHRSVDSRALLYAGDLSRPAVRRLLPLGAELVLTDTNRRQTFLPAELDANAGPTLGASDPIVEGTSTYDLFPGSGNDTKTVAEYSGARRVFTRSSRTFSLFPEHRPFAAVDGRLDTSWIASSEAPEDRFVEIDLPRPRYVDAVSIHPESDVSGATAVVGVSVNGGPERTVSLARRWNSVPVHASLRTLRVRVLGVANGALFAIGGIAEIRIPGVNVRESLRLPTDLASDTEGSDLSRNPITVLLKRTTADFPYRAGGVDEQPSTHDPLDMVDAEPGLVRTVELPAARRFSIDGWASVSPSAPDSAVDRLAGFGRGWRFDSSSRFEGAPASRASSAFDGDRGTSWIGDVAHSKPAWIEWHSPRPVTVTRIGFKPSSRFEYSFVSAIRVQANGRLSAPIRLGVDGYARLPRPVRADTMRIHVADTQPPRDFADQARVLRAVAVSEVIVPGLHPPRPARQGNFETACGELWVTGAGQTADARVIGTIAQLDQGVPLRMSGCGAQGTLALPRGSTLVSAPPGQVMRPDHLRLASAAPSPLPAPAVAGSVSGGTGFGGSSPHGIRLDVRAPAWLVLGQSYSAGWRAWCRDAGGRERSLGSPQPIDGYANGWPVGLDCRSARFAYGPQRAADASYLVSGVGCLVLLGLVALGVAGERRRGRRAPRAALAAWTLPGPDDVRRLRPLSAVLLAVGVGGLAWLLGWRAGIAIGALALVLGLAGYSGRRLLLLAAAGVVAVPVLYLIHPVANQGGFAFGYARQHLEAHWVLLPALACLAAAAFLEARAVRRWRR